MNIYCKDGRKEQSRHIWHSVQEGRCRSSQGLQHMAGVDMRLDGCLHPSSFQIFFFLVNKTPESHRFHAVRGVRVGLAPPLNAPADFRLQSDM